MRRVICRIAVATITWAWLSVPVLAQEKLAREEVEAILVQSLLEHAAFVACALQAKDTESVTMLKRAWRRDLQEGAALLRKNGFTDDYLLPLMARLDLDKVVPGFSDAAAAKAYCDTVGDWDRRHAMFFFSIPQVRLSQALKR